MNSYFDSNLLFNNLALARFCERFGMGQSETRSYKIVRHAFPHRFTSWVKKTPSERRFETEALTRWGIDTIHVSIPIVDGMIALDHALTVKARHDGSSPILWRNQHGEPITGHCAKFTRHGISVHISPVRQGYDAHGGVRCKVYFSLSGLVGDGDNLYPISRDEAERAFDRVQACLTEIGIHVDLRRQSLCRLDLFRNCLLEKPFSDYHPVFDLLDGLHLQKIVYSSTRTGILLKNQRQEISIYDVHANRRKTKYVRPTEHLPPYLMRCEWRLMKSLKIREKLGMNVGTISELLGMWDQLPEHLTTAFKTLCFDDHDKLPGAPLARVTNELPGDMPRQRPCGQPATVCRSLIKSVVKWQAKHGTARRRRGGEIESIVSQRMKEVVKRLKCAVRTRDPKKFKTALSELEQLVTGLSKRQIRTYINTKCVQMRRALLAEAIADTEFGARYVELQTKMLAPFPPQLPRRNDYQSIHADAPSIAPVTPDFVLNEKDGGAIHIEVKTFPLVINPTGR